MSTTALWPQNEGIVAIPPFDFAGMRCLCSSNVLSTVGPGKVPEDQWLALGGSGNTGR